MRIRDLQEKAKDDNPEKFRPIGYDTTFEWLDEWFGFITSNKLGDDKFISVQQLIEIYGIEQEYEEVE